MTLLKRSLLEASLKVMSCCAKLEAEAQDLKNNCELQLHQLASEVCMKLNMLTVNMQDKVFQDTRFHGRLSFVFSLQVIYYNFIIFLMHSFLKLDFHSAICIIYFFLHYLPLEKLRIVQHSSQKLRDYFFETIHFLCVIPVLP